MEQRYPDWVLKFKQKGAAIHKIGGNYYLFRVTSKWDKDLERVKKARTEYLGVITPDGIKRPRLERNRPVTVKEFGAVRFLIEGNKEIIDG